MRQNLRRSIQAVLFLSAAVVGNLVFQNCAAYEPAGFNPLYDIEMPSVCVGAQCSTDAQSLQLIIANQEPISVLNPAQGVPPTQDGCNISKCFDVAGYCDVAGFPSSTILAEIKGPTGTQSTDTKARCDDTGRFRARIVLPNNFNYNALYTLKLTLVAYDDAGKKVENPTGLHRKEISVSSYLPK